MAASEGILELDRNRSRAYFRIPSRIYAECVSMEAGPRGKWAWFRGVWGGCGAIYLPQQGYYMSFRVREGAKCGHQLTETLRSAGVALRVRKNGRQTEYTVRDLEGIITCLSRMGLVRTSLLLEETAVIRSVRGVANKRVNCDSANIDKSLTAARAQMSLVDAVDEYGLWGSLSPEVAELARMRRENPSASLGELGQILSKPVSKSTVEYRWRKLESLIGGKKYTRL
jgi:DNA-binding protein WhiA